MKNIRLWVLVCFLFFLKPSLLEAPFILSVFPKKNIEDSQLLFNVKNVYSIRLNMDVEFYNDKTSFVRILVKNKDKEFLLYETYPLVEDSLYVNIRNSCLETCSLRKIDPTSLHFQVIDASITNIYIEFDFNARKTRSQQNVIPNRLLRINEKISKNKLLWVAKETSFSKLSYAKKKQQLSFLTKDENLPHFYGAEYYAGGVYSYPGELSKERALSLTEFSWTYSQGTNWSTIAKDQGSCGSSSIFAATSAFESLIKIYFNAPSLEIDLSEQEIISCGSTYFEGNTPSCSDTGDETSLWNPKWALDYYIQEGAISEECFLYTGTDASCSKCPYPGEMFFLSSRSVPIKTIAADIDAIKEYIFYNGPIVSGLVSWKHAMALFGFGIVDVDEIVHFYESSNWTSEQIPSYSYLIGQEYLIFKNSWGEDWGEDGFAKIILNHPTYPGYLDIISDSYGLNIPIISTTGREIQCTDRDSDGYCYWGLSANKPSACPKSCLELKDCDDSNPSYGETLSGGNCKQIQHDYLISVEATEGGIVFPNGNIFVPSNSTLNLSITSYENYSTASIVVDNIEIPVSSDYVFSNITSNHSFKAVFEKP